MSLRVEAITNKLTSFHDALLYEMQSSRFISIASSFIDQDSVDILENILKKNERLQGIRLLIGVYGNFNRKQNLLRLLILAKKHSEKFQVHISRSKKFHWKYYHFTNRSTQNVFIGSANFTSGGLGSNHELVIKITDKMVNANVGTKRLNNEFEKEWEQSGSIAEFNVNEYNECRLPKGKTQGKSGNSDFFNSKKEQRNLFQPTPDKAVVTYLRYYISSKTERMIVNYRPDWSDVDLFICDNKREFELSCKIKRFLIIDKLGPKDFLAYWASFLNEAVLKTPDGQYFIAYKIVGKEKKLSTKIIEELTSKKGWNFKLFGRKNILTQKVIGKNQVMQIEELLKLKIKKSN